MNLTKHGDFQNKLLKTHTLVNLPCIHSGVELIRMFYRFVNGVCSFITYFLKMYCVFFQTLLLLLKLFNTFRNILYTFKVLQI